MFSILLAMLTQVYSVESAMWFFAALEWVIPVLIIHPTVMIISMAVIKQQDLNLNAIFSILIKSSFSLFIVSLLYKPMVFYGALKLSSIDVNNASLFDSIPKNDVYLIFSMAVIGMLISTLLTYFYPAFFTVSKNGLNKVSDKLKKSILLFLNFKWVTISFVLYFFTTFLMIKLLLLQFLLAITPDHLHQLFVQIVHGIERTVFYVFILRVYLYLNSTTNLSDS
ncbi:MAG: hypothetical protein VXX85_07660 [Candidatus Margulisiibacteriota bacterium]|nr:hypothetical protein [Candidatus Margulisiibacteriota bacterium]